MEIFVLTGGLGLFFVAGGVTFLLAGARRMERPARDRWLRVTGTVVAWEAVDVPRIASDQFVDRMMMPVVEYPLPDGTPHRFRNPTTLDTGIYRTGRPVEVLVDPADPRRAEMAATQTHQRLIGGVHSCLGAVLGAVGLLLLLGTGLAAILLT